jgi:hypothetical protein
VINITNLTCQDKPPWPPAGPTKEPARERAAESARGPAEPGRRIGGRIADIAGLAAAVLLSWLAYIPRRPGDRLFSWNDTEAYWRGWQIIKVHAGPGRCYRDPRFDTLTACPPCHGGGISTTNTPCAPCLGTGRISTEQVS